MKKPLVVCSVLIFGFALIMTALAEEINYEEAVLHKGEEATVCGKIIDFSTIPDMGLSVLGMGRGVMEQGAVGIEISDQDKDKFDKDLYVGKEVCVSGQVKENPVGGASLELKDPSQLKLQ